MRARAKRPFSRPFGNGRKHASFSFVYTFIFHFCRPMRHLGGHRRHALLFRPPLISFMVVVGNGGQGVVNCSR